jgi:hypothetical protein
MHNAATYLAVDQHRIDQAPTIVAE